MAYTLAEFAKLDLRRIGQPTPEGELFLPSVKRCSMCVDGWRTYLQHDNGFGWMGATCHFCLGTGLAHE